MTQPIKGGKSRILFSGDLTSANLDSMRDQLAEALTGSDIIEVELGKVGDVDGSLVELICSAHRVTDILGKSLTFGSVETVRRIRDLAHESGYEEFPCGHQTSGCLYQNNGGRIRRTDK